MLLPTPTRLFHLLVFGGVTLGFFRYFRVEGLDQLALALREDLQVQSGSKDGLFANALGTGRTSSIAPFPSTDVPIANPFGNPSGLGTPNSVPAMLPKLREDQRVESSQVTDRWAASQNTPSVQSAGFSASQPISVSPHGLLDRDRKLTLGAFHASRLDLNKLQNPFTGDRLVRIISDFSCVALQSVSIADRQLMPEFIAMLNATGRRFEFIEGSVHRENKQEGLVIVFDADQLEVDRYQTYTLRDETGSLATEPLVAWFRAKSEVPQEAFTFTFVNSQLTRSETWNETQLLPEILHSIFNDGRNEDDIIIAGSFATDANSFSQLRKQGCQVTPDIDPNSAANEVPVMVISSTCREYRSKSGTFNLIRRYNLTPQEANSISRFAPVWAEFDVREAQIY